MADLNIFMTTAALKKIVMLPERRIIKAIVISLVVDTDRNRAGTPFEFYNKNIRRTAFNPSSSFSFPLESRFLGQLVLGLGPLSEEKVGLDLGLRLHSTPATLALDETELLATVPDESISEYIFFELEGLF